MSLRLTLSGNLDYEAWPSSWHWHAAGAPGTSWMWSLLFMGPCAKVYSILSILYTICYILYTIAAEHVSESP